MKKLLKGYNELFSVEINLSRNRVVQIIAREKAKRRDFFDFFNSSPVNFSEVTISKEKIVIDVKPKMLNPCRGMGHIYMTLYSGKSSAKTKIEGEIIPYTNLYLIIIYLLICFLILWVTFVFATTSGISTFIMVAFSWTVFPLILYLIPFWYRSSLRDYKDSFLAILKENAIKKSSID